MMMGTSASACFVRAMRAALMLSFYQNAVSQLEGWREEECYASTYRHQGNDNGWMDLIEQPPASDSGECCQICTVNPMCEAWQWRYSINECSLFYTRFHFDNERYDEDFLTSTGTGTEPWSTSMQPLSTSMPTPMPTETPAPTFKMPTPMPTETPAPTFMMPTPMPTETPAPTFMPTPPPTRQPIQSPLDATCNAHTYRHQNELNGNYLGRYPTRDAGQCCADCREYEFDRWFNTNCTSFLWRSSDSMCWLHREPFIFTYENFHEGYIGGNMNASENPFMIITPQDPIAESDTSNSSLLIIIGGVFGGVVVLCACAVSCYFFAQRAIDKRVRHVQRQEAAAAAARANLVLQNGQAPPAAAARANVVLQNGQAPPVVAYEHKDGVVHVHHYHNESVPNAPPVQAGGSHVPHEGEAIRQPPPANDHITPANAPEEPGPDIEEDFAAPIKSFADAHVQLDNIPPPAYSED